MSQPPPSTGAAAAEDVLFALILEVLERALELAASADRGARLEELCRLTGDLDLFARVALSARAYAHAG